MPELTLISEDGEANCCIEMSAGKEDLLSYLFAHLSGDWESNISSIISIKQNPSHKNSLIGSVYFSVN
jgi:hypothetical protein